MGGLARCASAGCIYSLLYIRTTKALPRYRPRTPSSIPNVVLLVLSPSISRPRKGNYQMRDYASLLTPGMCSHRLADHIAQTILFGGEETSQSLVSASPLFDSAVVLEAIASLFHSRLSAA
ncbi:hypothetical protein EXIGLDRAFT_150002 [Exidia glandulosa HHB12029]|uniref:Uncharacterized protein n=1 Tax=Exidia glandulosa HHB12029 TaxID=1314781 RepID=A0A165FLD1_EXIGL|nr:hypothetical protein EXIGLDRAFT_150002 [Exidia glandulosa HHB12029]